MGGVRRIVAVCLVGLSAVACSLLTDTDGLSGPGNEPSAAPGPSQTGSDAGDDGLDGSVANPPKVACDPNEKPTPEGVFVSSVAGDDSVGIGAAQAPYKTLSVAIATAVAGAKTDLYLSTGAYAGALSLDDTHAGLTIHGGWSYAPATASWKRDCEGGPNGVVLSGKGATVTVHQSTKLAPVTLRDLTISTDGPEAASAAAGGSAYGVIVNGSSDVLLDDVKIVVAKGQDSASPNKPSAAGNTTCLGGSCPATATTGAAGPNGPTGTATFTANGWEGTLGSEGAAGTAGSNGTPGGSPETYSGTCYLCAQAGANCLDPPPPTTTVTGTGPGRCGCGGLGGKGGAPAPSGGASVGVFLSAPSHASLKAVAITVRGGGAGGAGGPGGNGGPGTGGSAGPTPGCQLSCSGGGTCTANSIAYLAGAGSPGGKGMSGGSGGAGGGGAGGASYGIVSVGGTTSEEGVVFLIGPGGAGQGGALGGGSGERLVP